MENEKKVMRGMKIWDVSRNISGIIEITALAYYSRLDMAEVQGGAPCNAAFSVQEDGFLVKGSLSSGPT